MNTETDDLKLKRDVLIKDLGELYVRNMFYTAINLMVVVVFAIVAFLTHQYIWLLPVCVSLFLAGSHGKACISCKLMRNHLLILKSTEEND